MLVSDFDFHLPEELIAKEPLADRAASRMLHLCRRSAKYEDRMFREFPDLLRPDDLVVFNNTRVFPARLFGRRAGLHAQPLGPNNPAMREFLRGRVEVLLTKKVASGEWPVASGRASGSAPDPKGPRENMATAPEGAHGEIWQALVRPGRKIDVGEQLYFGDQGELSAEVVGRGEFGERTLRFAPVPDFFALIEKLGHVPLPPYLNREDRPEDRERYQTVYARDRGSVAAPTAGLHFTPEILERMRARGVETAEITLHVGLGTFQPVHVAVVEEHKLHREWYSISDSAAAAIDRALQQGRRIVAVGTTTVRTLEYAATGPAAHDGGATTGPPGEGTGATCIRPGSGEADIFIYPGFQFRVVGALLTNFHLPQSTLLMLASALAGREHVLAAYKHAVESRYRFFSYGDCMFVE